jgi:leucyl aminopeptidase
MEIRVIQGNVAQQSDGVVVLGTWSDTPVPAAVTALIDPADWAGAFKKTLLVYVPAAEAPRASKGAATQGGAAASASFASRRVLLVGLGEQQKWTTERARQVGAVVAQKVRELKQPSFSLPLLGADSGLEAPAAAQALTEGLLLGLYRFDTFKTLADERVPAVQIETITLVVEGDTAPIEKAVRWSESVAAGVALTRDLGNNPPMVATPTHLANTAQRIASDYGMTCVVFDHDQQVELGMGGLLGVAKGADEPAKFIVLEHGTAEAGKPTVVLVGKGITFDSGGISIKPAESMDKMKMDMQGAGAVLGTMESVGRLKLPIHVVALIAASENMLGGAAYKPGDILTAMNGVTIEVLNTDAEGRLVLADALSYAQKYSPTAIIDLATLTGACVVALGSYAAGAMGNNPELMERLKQAASASGDRVWELPLWDEYKSQVRSDIADIKNTGGRNGGAITAAGFLSHFVGDYPWVHLDIAGVAWTEDQPKDYNPKGATGFGVRLLTELLREWSGVSL